jgi:hypothetical protein
MLSRPGKREEEASDLERSVRFSNDERRPWSPDGRSGCTRIAALFRSAPFASTSDFVDRSLFVDEHTHDDRALEAQLTSPSNTRAACGTGLPARCRPRPRYERSGARSAWRPVWSARRSLHARNAAGYAPAEAALRNVGFDLSTRRVFPIGFGATNSVFFAVAGFHRGVLDGSEAWAGSGFTAGIALAGATWPAWVPASVEAGRKACRRPSSNKRRRMGTGGRGRFGRRLLLRHGGPVDRLGGRCFRCREPASAASRRSRRRSLRPPRARTIRSGGPS